MKNLYVAVVSGLVATVVAVGCGPAAEAKSAAAHDSKVAPSTSSSSGSSSSSLTTGEMSLEDKETWEQYNAKAAEWLAAVNQRCGTKMTGGWDMASWKGYSFKDRWSLDACQRLFDGVDAVCNQGDLQKKAVQKKITSISCKKATGKGSTLDLVGGVVFVSIDPTATDYGSAPDRIRAKL